MAKQHTYLIAIGSTEWVAIHQYTNGILKIGCIEQRSPNILKIGCIERRPIEYLDDIYEVEIDESFVHDYGTDAAVCNDCDRLFDTCGVEHSDDLFCPECGASNNDEEPYESSSDAECWSCGGNLNDEYTMNNRSYCKECYETKFWECDMCDDIYDRLTPVYKEIADNMRSVKYPYLIFF